jgi:hypothetical protein
MGQRHLRRVLFELFIPFGGRVAARPYAFIFGHIGCPYLQLETERV